MAPSTEIGTSPFWSMKCQIFSKIDSKSTMGEDFFLTIWRVYEYLEV